VTALGSPPSPSAASGSPRVPVVRDRGTVRLDAIQADRWLVTGTAKVARNVTTEELRLRGLLTVGGTLATGSLGGKGTIEVEGSVDVRGTLAMAGTLRGAGVHAADLDVRGTLRSAGPLRIDRQGSIVGALEAPELSAPILQLDGGVRVPGRTQAGTVHAQLRETSEFGTIAARSVWLHGKVANLVDKVFFHSCTVTVGRIEAETVDLEGIDVEFVRSPQIVLGRSCHVTRVEGTIVRQHPSSFVGPESRTPAPYGLRR